MAIASSESSILSQLERACYSFFFFRMDAMVHFCMLNSRIKNHLLTRCLHTSTRYIMSKPLVVNYHGVRCEFERKTVSRLISALLTRRCESSKIMRTQVEKNRCAHGAKSEMYKVQRSTVYNPGKSLLRSQIEYMQY